MRKMSLVRGFLFGLFVSIMLVQTAWAKTDLLRFNGSSWYARTYDSSGSQMGGEQNLNITSSTLILSDENNDGRVDTIYKSTTDPNGRWFARTYMPAGVQPGPGGTEPNPQKLIATSSKDIVFGDFANDGSNGFVAFIAASDGWRGLEYQPAGSGADPNWYQAYVTFNNMLSSGAGRDQIKLGDFNNDGYVDFMYFEGGAYNNWYARTYWDLNGNNDPISHGIDFKIPDMGPTRPFMLADLNTDGTKWLIYFEPDNANPPRGNWYARLYNANSTGEPASTKVAGDYSMVTTYDANGLVIGDYDNDGINEILYHDRNGSWYARTVDGSSSDINLGITDNRIVLGNYNNSPAVIPAGDVDKDGDVDYQDIALLARDWLK